MYSNAKAAQADLNKGFPPAQAGPIKRTFGLPVSARVTADVTYNATATLANIADLSMVVDEAANYAVHGYIRLSIANAAHNIKLDFDGGSCTATLVDMSARFSLANGTEALTNLTALATDADGSTANAWVLLEIDGILRVNAGGTLILRGAQSASGASASVIKAGSFITLTPIV